VGLLIAARVAQGLAGAPMVPLAMSLILDPARALTLAPAGVASVVLFAVLFLAPVFPQQIQHHGTTVTGLVLLPRGVVMGQVSWPGSAAIERGDRARRSSAARSARRCSPPAWPAAWACSPPAPWGCCCSPRRPRCG
jgi:MFS family permease